MHRTRNASFLNTLRLSQFPHGPNRTRASAAAVSYTVFSVAHPCLTSGISVSYDASWEEWNHFILPAQRTMKIECGPDQREVCKGLRKVAQCLAYPSTH